MAQSKTPKLLDMVAVLESAANDSIAVGDVGTVVEVLPPDGIEVEFIHRNGRTRTVATLNVGDVLVLNRERTPVG